MIEYELPGVAENVVNEDGEMISFELDEFSSSNDLLEENCKSKLAQYLAEKIFKIVIDNDVIYNKRDYRAIGLFNQFKEEYNIGSIIKYEYIQYYYNTNECGLIITNGKINVYFKGMMICTLKCISLMIDKNTKIAKWSGDFKLTEAKGMNNYYWKQFFKIRDKIYCVDLYFLPDIKTYMDIPEDLKFLYPMQVSMI